MMYPYIIAPNLVRVNLDRDLSSEFQSLNSRLQWRPLTTNLESCEEPPYLYFRVILSLREKTNTYAGFATGAPFMLTRDKDFRKRAFFLRHWVRRVSPTEHKDAPLTDVDHIAIGACDNYLLARVEIDRPLVTRDTFKSIPFATWMFQVVQIDAVVTELPGVRFAFAIERTVTAEERQIVANAGHSIPAKGPKMKPLPSTAYPSVPHSSPYTSQPSTSFQRNARPLMRQGIQPNLHASPMQQSLVMQRPPAYTAPSVARPSQNPYQHNPFQFSSTRQIQPAVMQSNGSRSQPIVPSQLARPSQRVYARPTPPPAAIPPPTTSSDAKLLNPYLKLWEDRDADDPYEPIFITRDDKFDSSSRRSVVIETTEEHAKRLDYQNMYGIPSADYPVGFFEGPEMTTGTGEADIEIVVGPRKRPRYVGGYGNENVGNNNGDAVDDEAYSAAVVAAASYNAVLRQERGELKKWLEEDAAREEEESDDEDDDDEADQDSSD